MCQLSFLGASHIITPATPVTLSTMGMPGLPATVTPAAVHQMPSVISKPKLYVSQPSQIVSMASNNGPTMAGMANGSYPEIKKEGKLGIDKHLGLQTLS